MRYRRYQGFNLNPILIIVINLLMLVVTFISPRITLLLGLVPAIFLSVKLRILMRKALIVNGYSAGSIQRAGFK